MFAAIQKSRLYDAIVTEILDGIRSGRLSPGAMLPAERALAEQFGVGRSSVREALRVLEHAGVLEVRVGKGAYVTDGAQSKMSLLRAEATMAGDVSPLDVISARLVLEPECAERAAVAHTANDAKELSQHLQQQRALVDRGDDPAEPDLRVHLAIAEATHNEVFAALVAQLMQMMGQSTWNQLRDQAQSRNEGGTHHRSLGEHEALVAAILDRDGAAARGHMTGHLRAIEQVLLESFD
jgi:GntR family transcriptional repressor for pyruvate dehydrogenase complex